MLITNEQIIRTYNALDSLSNKEMPITLTYKVMNNLDRLLEAYRVYEKTLSKTKNDEEVQELLNIEVDVDVELLEKQELIDAGITLTPVHLNGLKRLIYG